MRRVVYVFLDGVGIGEDVPEVNPLSAGQFSFLDGLLQGVKLAGSIHRLSTQDMSVVAVDACLGIAGRPQSATGQAAILTGINAPARLGEHYGPRPDARVRRVVDEGNLFRQLRRNGMRTYFCNAYPPSYFAAVARGKRLLSAVPYAAQSAGQCLPTIDDLMDGSALAADFTNEGWRTQLSFGQVPVFAPRAGGRRLWEIAKGSHFTFFEHWLTDLLGHRRQHQEAVENFVRFDNFLRGLWEAADLDQTLIVVGSDHGNVEDCSTRKHTYNPALCLVLGNGHSEFAAKIHGLDDYAPAILAYLGQ